MTMILEDILLEIFGKTAVPLKAGDIAKEAKRVAGKQATPKVVAAALEAMAAGHAVNRIEAGTKPVLYTTRSLEDAAAAMLRLVIQGAKKEMEAGKLKAKLPMGLQGLFEAGLERLVEDGGAFVLAGKKRLVYAQKPKPSALLSTAQRGALKKIFDSLIGAQATSKTLGDFIAWLDGEQPAEVAAPPQVRAVLPAPDEGLLCEWYEHDRLRSSTMMIPIPQTFARYAAWANAHGGEASRAVLREVMERLYNEGRILLEPCEKPQDLPEDERAMLVPMALGPPGWSWCWVGES